jgi:diguanylate cyclase (GGDEF)-like protein
MGLTREQITFRAALSRFVVAGAALALVPTLFPRAREHAWVLVGYLAIACVEQALIAKRFGGRVRSLVAGVIDLGVVTWFIHLLGSTTTVLAATYFFVGALNTLVVGLRVGIALAALNALAYDAVVWAEYARWLPYAPDRDDATRTFVPTFAVAVTATALVTTLLVASTAVVGMLVHALRRHEADLTAANARLEDLSHRDALTGLYNRRFLFDSMERELARVRRGKPLAVLMLDLDGFKHVNDEQGHLRGDLLLDEIGKALAASTRIIDVAARYGGDEFVLLLPDTDAPSAELVAKRVTDAVKDVGTRFDAARPVTASVGVAVAHPDDSPASLIRRADESAYAAKKGGGDRVVLAA